MLAELERQWPRVVAVATCLVLAIWLSAQGSDQGQVRSAADALARGDRAGAVDLARGVTGRPARVRALVVEGDALTQEGRHAAAAVVYARAVDLAPNDWKLRRSLAVAYASSGQNTAGQRQLTRAEVLNPRIVASDDLPNP